MNPFRRRTRPAPPEAEPQSAEDAIFVRAAREAARIDRDEAAVLRAMDLPDPGDLQAGDDFSAFLAPDVPPRLRMRALRRLWRVDPVLASLGSTGQSLAGPDLAALPTMSDGTVPDGAGVPPPRDPGLARKVRAIAQTAMATADRSDKADRGLHTPGVARPALPGGAPKDPRATRSTDP